MVLAKTHRLGFALLTLPGLLVCGFALFADVIRGGELVKDWGTGQSVILTLGILLLTVGVGIHQKASRDESSGERLYNRTLAFIVSPLVLLIGLPLVIGEGLARAFPVRSTITGGYQHSDPALGFSLIPNREYHVVSRPKNFDVHIRIDSNGHRIGDKPIEVSNADVVVLGDSHPFGFGISEDQTLPMHLARNLSSKELPSRVLNAGVPGYGIGQSLLCMQSLDTLREGAVVVVFINPMNDLINLSSSIDYHYTKPHATLRDGDLVFEAAPTSRKESFRFSPKFHSLNEYFDLGPKSKWYRCELATFVSHLVASQHANGDPFIDQMSAEDFLANDVKRVSSQPMLYASRYWTEMPQFEKQRTEIAELTEAVFAEMKFTADSRGWHVMAIVACEAHQWQAYAQNFMRQVEEAATKVKIETGWSRETVIQGLRKASIPAVVADYQSLDPEPLFIQNDDHTSGEGHRRLAVATANKIATNGWFDAEPSK